MMNRLPGLAASGTYLLVLLLCALAPATARAQTYSYSSNEGMWLNAQYHVADDLTSWAVGVDMVSVGGIGTWGWQAGVSAGPASAPYQGGLPSGVIRDAVTQDMSGTTLVRYETPDDTDGGFMFGGKLMAIRYIDVNFSFAVGPRVNYFTGHDISVLHVSSGGGYEYTAFAQVPYLDPVMIPGIEVQLQPGTQLGLNYAYLFRPDGQTPMHMFGIGWLLAL